jgi:Transcriptional Coactivator p15 (PC4)
MTNGERSTMSEVSNGTAFIEWRRARGDVVRLVVQKFKGQDLLHLRVFYPDEKGNLKPSPQGVTIPHPQLGPLRKALRKAEKELSTVPKPVDHRVKRKRKWPPI